MVPEVISTDVLILGAGGAGARAAYEAGNLGMDVTVVCRDPVGKGGATPSGNGGFHASMNEGDSPEKHAEDLIKMGRQLNDRNLVKALTEESESQARLLDSLGADVAWKIPTAKSEPGMQFSRNLCIPGREIMSALGKAVKKLPNVKILEYTLVLKLLKDGDAVSGAVLFDLKMGKVIVYTSKTTILATGSLGEIYPLSAHAAMGLSTGSFGGGYAMAADAGAELVDMEMVQFTMMATSPKIINAMRCLPTKGEMRNAKGELFLTPEIGPYSYQAAQLIDREYAEKRGPVTMDLRSTEFPKGGRHRMIDFKNNKMREFSATPYQRPIELNIGVLYQMGGVFINEKCETSVPRLYAAGEVSGNVHGARRIAGNAFPEMIVFGARAGRYASEAAKAMTEAPKYDQAQVDEVVAFVEGLVSGKEDGVSSKQVLSKVRSTMRAHAFMIRDHEGLETALKDLDEAEKLIPKLTIQNYIPTFDSRFYEAFDAIWAIKTARLVCLSALEREETRGFHIRADFPDERPEWLKHTMVCIRDGKYAVGDQPIQQVQ